MSYDRQPARVLQFPTFLRDKQKRYVVCCLMTLSNERSLSVTYFNRMLPSEFNWLFRESCQFVTEGKTAIVYMAWGDRYHAIDQQTANDYAAKIIRSLKSEGIIK